MSKIKKVLIALVLMLGTTAYAQNAVPQWMTVIENAPASMKSQLVSSSEESIKVHIQVPGFYTTAVNTPRGKAHIISVPNSVSTAEAGEPNVPMIGVPVMIGDKAQMSVRIIDAKYRDFEDIEVAPSKGDFPRTVDPATVPYTYGKCYSENTFFPASNAELYAPYILRDFRGQNIAVHPFVYNPVTKTLRVYYDLTVEMYKVDDNGQNTLNTRRTKMVKMDADFKNVYHRHFLNYEAGSAKYTPVDEEGDLLIICYDSFINAMTDFVNWKKTRGVNTTIVGTSTAGTTYSAIKTYIQNQYNANNNLTHVLLVGDVAQIPGYTYSGASGYEGKGDNPYGQVVGNDVYNDLFVGRFSAQNVAQVQTQVQRVITYERDLTTSDTWLQKGEGIGKTEGNSSQAQNGEEDYEHIELIRGDLINYGYNTVYQDYASTSGYTCSATTISNHFNSGVGIANYCNHGDNQMWGVASYSNVQVNALTNENKLPFIWSTACYVGKYDNTETTYGSGATVGQSNDCFAEAWMHATNNARTQPTGAIGALMSYISQPWQPPMWGQDECVDILVGSYNSNIKHTWGGVSINGIMGIFDHYSTSTAQAVGTYQAWVLYGDPSMMLRTKTPQAMTVTHDGAVIPGATTYTVNVGNGNGALATITDANHNILGKATVTNGTANISLNGTLNVGSDLTLCVFGYNKVTSLETIQVIAPSGPYISLDSYTPNVALVGEDTDLSLTFKNVGVEATTGTTNVTLTSADNNVTIIDGTDSFDVLASDDTVTLSGFQFRLNQGVTLGSPVTLHYTATNGDNVWEGNIAITPNQIFTVTVAANDDDFGTVSDGGQFDYNTSCTVTATPADGYIFTNWTLNGQVVSINTEYTFEVTSDAALVANFALGVVIGSGTTTNQNLPSYSYYKYSLSEQIYTPAELGGAGLITSIAFYNGGSTQTRNLDIYLKSTTKNAFSSTSDWIAVTANDKVFSGNVTMTSNDWTTITFTTPFLYDGNSNVVLVVDDNTGSYSSSNNMACRVFSTTGSQALYTYSDGTNYNPSSPSSSSSVFTATVKNQLIVTKTAVDASYSITVSADPTYAGTVTGGGEFSFGDICTVTATANQGYYFSGWTEYGQVVSKDLSYSFSVFEDRSLVATFKEGIIVGEGSTEMNTHLPTYSYYKYSLTEQLYTPDEIGTAGLITAIGFYNGGAEKSRTFDLYLVHTDKTAFTSKTDWITVSDADKAFSGEVTMVVDDWTFITLSKPFAYDGTSNLAVIIDDNTASSSVQPHLACRVYSTESNQALYAHSSKTNYDPSVAPASQSTNNNMINKKNQVFFNIVTPGTLELGNDDNSNETAINEAAATGKLYNVTLSGRTLFKDGEWNTLCLPFDVVLEGSLLDGATAKTLTGASMDTKHVGLTFGNPDSETEPVKVLKAGIPYIIKWELGNDIENPVFQGVTVVSTAESDRTIEKADGQVKFIGYYDAFNIDADDTDIYYMASNSQLKHTAKPRTLKSCRAFFRFADAIVKSTRQFVMNFDGDVTTGVSLTPNPSPMGEGSWYTVDGMKLDQQPVHKGVYIHNGHKVVIK